MKFFQKTLPPRVWCSKANKVVVVFENGEFETNDPALIALLHKSNYEFESKKGAVSKKVMLEKTE